MPQNIKFSGEFLSNRRATCLISWTHTCWETHTHTHACTRARALLQQVWCQQELSVAPHVAMVTVRRLATNSCSRAHVFFPFIFPALQLLPRSPPLLLLCCFHSSSFFFFSSSVCVPPLDGGVKRWIWTAEQKSVWYPDGLSKWWNGHICHGTHIPRLAQTDNGTRTD